MKFRCTEVTPCPAEGIRQAAQKEVAVDGSMTSKTNPLLEAALPYAEHGLPEALEALAERHGHLHETIEFATGRG